MTLITYNLVDQNRARCCLGRICWNLSLPFFAFAGTQVANSLSDGSPTQPIVILYISIAFGFSLVVNAWVFFRISGGLFNPAVTLGMTLIGAISIKRSVGTALIENQPCGRSTNGW